MEKIAGIYVYGSAVLRHEDGVDVDEPDPSL